MTSQKTFVPPQQVGGERTEAVIDRSSERGWMRRHRWILAAAIVAGVVLLGVAVVRDIARIDPTSGGYDPPYTDAQGEPIDWSAMQTTDTGFRDDGGWVLNMSLDCTTGQLRLHSGPVTIDYRTLSERAIVVHQPHVACEAAGFTPQWDASATQGG